MRGSGKFIAVTAAVAVCSFFATTMSAPTPITAALAFGLLASLGYVWVQVILRGRAPTLELVSVAVGLILAVPVIGGVVLQADGIPLHRLTWSALLVGLTLVGDAFLAVRYRSEARDRKYEHEYPLLAQLQDRPQDTRPNLRPRRHISPWQASACGLALLVTGGAIWLAQAGAASQHYPGFTQLWLINHSHSTTMRNLGVTNQEGVTENYRLVLLRNGRVSATWRITLNTGHSWQRAVQVTTQTRANLYLLPDLKSPYRYVDTQP